MGRRSTKGRSCGVADDIAGRGSDRPGPVTRKNSTPFSRRRENLQRILKGPNPAIQRMRQAQVQDVVVWVTDSGSASLSLSPTWSSAEFALLVPAAPELLSSTSSPCISSEPSEPQVMQQSLIFFDDSAGKVSMDHPHSPVTVKEEVDSNDALMFEDVDMGGPTQHVSDDDKTQVPTTASFCNVAIVKKDEDEEWVEDAVKDEEELDPTWNEDQASDMSSTEEEMEVAQSPQHSKRGRRVQNPTDPPLAATPTSAIYTREPRPPKTAARSSLAWQFFRQCTEDKTRVFCKLCNQSLKRGVNVLNLSTTCMIRHLNAKHLVNQERPLAPAPSSAASSHTSGVTEAPGTPQTEDLAMPPPQSLGISTMSHGMLSNLQTLERKRKYPPTHPRSLSLNASISKLLVFEMLSSRLVETESFKNLMAVAVPQYVVPGRHYFSRRAIPALYNQVGDKIRSALDNDVCGKVHITTDTWTGKPGQGRYISLTAHWVNIVAAGTEANTSSAHVLPPPKIGGRFPLPPVASSSQHSASFTTNFSAARGKRQRAVFKLLCLGDKPHTAQELWRVMEQQTDEWLVPMGLKPGLVVCDNGRNLVAALGLGGLTHIPCLAHVLNMVVQRFLKNYPNMSELLQKVRTVCASFQRSHPCAAHRFLCDVPTRWNSTFHMLDRLCEQKQAIMEFQLENARVSPSADQHRFTTSEWAFMRDVCSVLRCFEYSTNMASANDAILSVTIPVVCLLEKTLRAMMEEVVAKEEEEEITFPQLSDQSLTSGSEGGSQHQHRPGRQFSSQGTDLKDEEEPCSQQGGTQSSSGPSLQRGWGDTEDIDNTPPIEGSFSLPLGSLAHMSDYMLQCLRNDCRVAHIITSTDYWVATLLDPRYKDNVPSLIPSLERDQKMSEYKRLLVEALLTAFPPETGVSTATRDEDRGGRSRQRRTASTSEGRVSMAEMWKSFVSHNNHHQPAPPADIEHLSRRQHFSNMVEEYLCTRLHLLTDGSAPFNFWVSKLGTWPELALYALEVLACPAASVLSERVFSTGGDVITDRCNRLSTANDKLTFIKMNQEWIPQDLTLPGAE